MRRMLSKLFPILAGALLLLLIAAPARAGEANVVGHFENGGVTAEIDTYSETGTVVAILAFTSNGRTMTFAFDRKAWPSVERLWQSAKQVRGQKFVSIGSTVETGGDEKCVITAASGPGIRLTIVSPIDGAVVFNVPRGAVAEFDAKLRQAASMTTSS
jgi:hypothetical protein